MVRRYMDLEVCGEEGIRSTVVPMWHFNFASIIAASTLLITYQSLLDPDACLSGGYDPGLPLEVKS